MTSTWAETASFFRGRPEFPLTRASPVLRVKVTDGVTTVFKIRGYSVWSRKLPSDKLCRPAKRTPPIQLAKCPSHRPQTWSQIRPVTNSARIAASGHRLRPNDDRVYAGAG